MRVAIYGAGAMGTAMGAYFARAGKAVDVICRNRAHVSAMRKSGVRISGTDDFTAEVNALLPSAFRTGRAAPENRARPAALSRAAASGRVAIQRTTV